MKTNQFKKVIGFFTMAVVLTIVGCTSEAPVEKEVVVVPTEKVVIQKEEPAENPTKITLDKKGIKVETDKVDLTIGDQ